MENARGAVIFLPGVHGGVGPGRQKGQHYDENAIFPTVAKLLQAQGISSYRISWKYMMPTMREATGAAFATYLYSKPSRLALVGHSLGGAVVYAVAHILRRAEAEVVGVCSLAAQYSGAGEVVSQLPMNKLFIHGTHDAVIPLRCCDELHDLAMYPKAQVHLEGAEHDFFHHKHIVEKLVYDFICRCM